MTGRIAPLEPPYPDAMQADFDKLMRGAPPLTLFRVIGRNPRVLQRMMAGGLLDTGSIGIRERELMILRSTARCGAEYEWGVHVAAFAHKCPWTEDELAATRAESPDAPCWSDTDRAVIALADALHDTQTVDDTLWDRARAVFDEAQLIELVMLAGLYHAVSYCVNAFRVPLEGFAPRFPGRV